MNAMKVLAIRDRQLNAFMQPFFAPTIGTGIRAFADMLNDKQSEPAKHPEDYDLYHLADFDTTTGQFTTQERPTQVAIGTNLLRQ